MDFTSKELLIAVAGILFAVMGRYLDNHEKRIDNHDKQIKELEGNFANLDKKIDLLNATVSFLPDKMSDTIKSSINTSIDKYFETINRKL